MKCKPVIIFCISLLIAAKLTGQETGISPYSIYGIGDIETRGLAQHIGMGDTKYSLFNSANVNLANPAANAMIGQAIFDVNIASRRLILSNPAGIQQNGEGYFKSFLMGIPLGPKAGFTFGLAPFTRVGFDISEPGNNEQLGNLEYLYSGSGGFNQAVLGFGAKVYRDSTNLIMLGINGYYNFGFIKNSRSTSFVNASGLFPSIVEQQIRINDFSFETGLFYRKNLSEKFAFNLGLTYGLAAELNGSSQVLAGSFVPFSTGNQIKDTLINTDEEISINMPHLIGIGLNFEISRKLNLVFEYQQRAWQNLSIGAFNPGLKAASQFNFGAQFIPDYTAINNLLKTIRYRSGFRYNQTRIQINGEQLDEFGISFGLGIPLIKSMSNSMVQIAVEVGQRGDLNNGLLQENFTRFNIGFTFTPHKFDRWFTKRKIE